MKEVTVIFHTNENHDDDFWEALVERVVVDQGHDIAVVAVEQEDI